MGMRTSEGLSESVTAQQVLSSIIMFTIIYAMLFGVWIFVLNHKIQHGPETPEEMEQRRLRLAGESMSHVIGRRGSSHGGAMLQEDGDR